MQGSLLRQVIGPRLRFFLKSLGDLRPVGGAIEAPLEGVEALLYVLVGIIHGIADHPSQLARRERILRGRCAEGALLSFVVKSHLHDERDKREYDEDDQDA